MPIAPPDVARVAAVSRIFASIATVPLVSVIIPVYNPGNFLNRSVASALQQTVRDLECIVVDDGSSEDVASLSILADTRVRYLRQANRGVSVARNVGVSVSHGRYIAFLDQDDEWLPGKLEAQLAALAESPAASFAHTPFVWVLPGREQPSGQQRVTYLGSLAGDNSYVCLSSLLVERAKHDAVGGHDPLLAQQQDWDFVLRLLMTYGPPVSTVESLVRYFVHGGNASGDYAAAEREAKAVLQRHQVRAVAAGDRPALRAVRAGCAVSRRLHSHQALDHARASIGVRSWQQATRHFLASLALGPKVALAALSTAVARRLARRGPV